jgi:polysaccharide pyruvyl transferase WcaK-like protein
MNLNLVNEYSSHNLGDAVIYETLVQLAAPLLVRSTMPHALRAYARGLHDRSPHLASDVNLSVGGDIFNNARPWLATRRFLHNVQSLDRCDPARTFLFGQSIPASCRGLALRLLARTLKRLSSVTVRDVQSHARLRQLGVPAALSYDLAFAYRPGERSVSSGAALFAQAGVDAERCVLFSVREFDAMYPGDRDAFVRRLAAMALRLQARGHRPALLIQAASTGGDSDLDIARVLQALVPGLAVLNPFMLPPAYHPVDAVVGAIGQARSVVAVRYHTAVLRLLAGRHPYSLHYSTKGLDLAQRVGLSGCPLEVFDPMLAVSGIEACADAAFDPSPLRRHVQESFALGLSAALSAATLQRARAGCVALPAR